MKKIIIAIVLFVGTLSVQAQEINWITLDEALELQKKTPKKIFMDIYTNWCGPCKALDRNTFKNKDVVAYINKNYYAVKFNAEGNDVINYKGKTYKNPNYDPKKANRRNSSHQFTQYMRFYSYPTLAFFDEEGNLIFPSKGYHNPNQLEIFLKLFFNDDHKKIKTPAEFDKYKKEFKHTFKK